MKLYTEEQIRKAMVNWSDYPMQDVIDKLNPIELPSDEEIDNIAPRSGIALTSNAFKLGAKWMRDKIQGGNNDSKTL